MKTTVGMNTSDMLRQLADWIDEERTIECSSGKGWCETDLAFINLTEDYRAIAKKPLIGRMYGPKDCKAIELTDEVMEVLKKEGIVMDVLKK